MFYLFEVVAIYVIPKEIFSSVYPIQTPPFFTDLSFKFAALGCSH